MEEVSTASKRIGILGGISHKSTIRYYDTILRKYYELRGDYHYPEVVIFSVDFQKFTRLSDKGDMEGYIQYIVEGIRCLENAAVDFAIIAANTPHVIFEKVAKQSRVPMISIVEVVAKKAESDGMEKLLLTGTKLTMQTSYYREACKKYGIELVTPAEEEQDEINRMIYDELVLGIITEKSKGRFLEIVSKYDVDAVILGCTELPLLVTQEDTDLKLLDTMELHAEAALNYSLAP